VFHNFVPFTVFHLRETQLRSGVVAPIPIFLSNPVPIPSGSGLGWDETFRDLTNYFISKCNFLFIQKFNIIFRKNKTRKHVYTCQEKQCSQEINKYDCTSQKTNENIDIQKTQCKLLKSRIIL